MDMTNKYDLICFFKTMLTRRFCYSFCFFYNKKTCFSVHSTAIGDVLLEREFNYLLYDIIYVI